MARSRLLRYFSSALRDYRASLPGALAGLDASRSVLSRRQFMGTCLGASALAFASGTVAGCGKGRASTGKAGPSVAIVGGGIAGLHCAYRLRKLGIEATVYDAASRLGGRILSDRATFPGMHCELGGELIDTGHETMRGLAQELGIELLDYQADIKGLDEITGFIAGRKLSRAELVDGFTPIAAAIDAALATLGDADAGVSHRQPNGGEALDRLSLSAWLDSIGAAGPVRQLLEVAYTIEFGLDPAECNVLNMLLMISTAAEKLALFGDSDERFHAAQGNDRYISGLAAGLDGGRITLGHRLERLGSTADGRSSLSFAHDAGAREVVADHVVLALPFSLLRGVALTVELPAIKRRAIAEQGYGSNTKLMCGFTGRRWRDQGSDGQVFTDLPFQNTWDTSRLQPGVAGIITNFTGGAHARALALGDAAGHAAAFIDGFEQVFPGVKADATGKAVRMAWSEQPWVKGSYSSYLVGQYTAFAGTEGERVGNLHFCGEHTCLDAQGYMEGGALSGAWVADEIAQDLGLKKAAVRGGRRDRRLAQARFARSAAAVG